MCWLELEGHLLIECGEGDPELGRGCAELLISFLCWSALVSLGSDLPECPGLEGAR